ncbi:MAG: RNA polymerase subunit sigma-24 [Bacteroidetes bacterium HGW-Bacteroidetes-17]|jgi:RNA polymerase sigma-70 factor (ECF subfamily)|nr:MAG: RNA polymerase subunit sigma-24 [Bacteroidetes bacterium HGW-Bacteroidetes-17]
MSLKMKVSEKEKLFTDLFSKNKGKIYRLCSAYLIDKTEVNDLFQEVMINVWNNIEKFRGESQISTWVYRIAVNTAFMFNKKAKKNKELFLRFSPDSHPLNNKPEETGNEPSNEMIKILHQTINTLANQDKIIISLVLEGLKYEEIGAITGLTLSNVGVKINRIKSVLLKRMKEVQNG